MRRRERRTNDWKVNRKRWKKERKQLALARSHTAKPSGRSERDTHIRPRERENTHARFFAVTKGKKKGKETCFPLETEIQSAVKAGREEGDKKESDGGGRFFAAFSACTQSEAKKGPVNGRPSARSKKSEEEKIPNGTWSRRKWKRKGKEGRKATATHNTHSMLCSSSEGYGSRPERFRRGKPLALAFLFCSSARVAVQSKLLHTHTRRGTSFRKKKKKRGICVLCITEVC